MAGRQSTDKVAGVMALKNKDEFKKYCLIQVRGRQWKPTLVFF